MKKFVMFGQNPLFGDYADLVHALGGRLARVVVNVPDPPRENTKSFAERIAEYNTWLADRHPDVPAAEVVELEEFEPDPEETAVLGFRGLSSRPLRERVKSEFGIEFPPLVHPTAWVSPMAEVGEGTVICPLAAMASFSKIGAFGVINRCASVGHDTVVGDDVDISPNATLGSNIRVGDGARLGLNCSVIECLELGEYCYVAAGAAVIRDVPAGVAGGGRPGGGEETTGLMRVEVYQREPHRQLWEEFVEGRARNAHFMHRRRFLEYHGDRFKDHSLLLFGEGGNPDPIALLPAHRRGEAMVSHGGLSFGGLLVGRRFRFEQWREAFTAIGRHAAGEGFAELDYRPPPPWYQEVPGEEDVYLLESAGAEVQLSAAAVRRMDGEFYGNETRRRDSRAEVQVEREDAALAAVMELVEVTLQERHGAEPVHTLGEIEMLAERFPDEIRCYTARAHGLLGGVVLFVSGPAVKLQYVGYSDGKAMSAIYAHLFEAEEFRGRWFDFGTSMAEDGSVDTGLLEYKESLGARLACVRRYRVPVASLNFEPC